MTWYNKQIAQQLFQVTGITRKIANEITVALVNFIGMENLNFRFLCSLSSFI